MTNIFHSLTQLESNQGQLTDRLIPSITHSIIQSISHLTMGRTSGGANFRTITFLATIAVHFVI